MLKRIISISLLVLGISLWVAMPSYSSRPVVHVADLPDVTINPVTAQYISQSIEQAYQDGAKAIVFKLDTPGGLLNSTRLIVRDIVAAPLPVIVYIAPGGARAGSAGVFITYAAHVAAMAPSTNIGAAHPVQLNSPSQPGQGTSKALEEILKRLRNIEENQELDQDTKEIKEMAQKEDEETSSDAEPVVEHKDEEVLKEELKPDASPMESKILQDTVAFVRALAQLRNRNEAWAVKSVAKSDSITDEEALEIGVVDVVAKSVDELLVKIDGHMVEVRGEEVVLNTKGAEINRKVMGVREKILGILADPNIAYILMILGFYGLLYEMTHPGFGVPGVFGVIFLILSFYSMQTLPVNYAGMALIGLSVILFIAEAIAPGIGLLALGGVVSMVLGSLMLFDSDLPMMQVSLSLIIALTATTAGITIFLIRSVISSRKLKVKGGKEGLVGAKGDVRRAIPEQGEGKVFVGGTLWSARADEPLVEGTKVIVVESEGLILKVKKEA